MSGYIGINLRDLLKDEEIGENTVKKFLSTFYCPLNSDVEHFLKNTAIEFTKQGLASTYLIMASYKNEYVLCGYFTLAIKSFCLDKDAIPNSKWRKRLNKFARFDNKVQRYIISAPLIGQLGKNYANDYNTLISGDELLLLALNKVREMQYIAGGKIVYLECERKENLIDFYSRNGFVNFGERALDRDETSLMSGESLIQMLRYMD